MALLEISVIVPTHNPHVGRLRRTLAGLRDQTLPAARWETLLVDNASATAIDPAAFADVVPSNLRVIREPTLGLTPARRAGFRAARGEYLVLVDDDNVLAPDYLAQVVTVLAANPKVGAAGGRSLPEFEITPPDWAREFDGLIACRDLGQAQQVSHGLSPAGTAFNIYPAFAPIGAGMALRRAAVDTWLRLPPETLLSDRRGNELTSGGDNDLVLTLMEHDWDVGYFPALSLTHLIPAARLEPAYLARLNRSIAKSWIQVLARHGACPWAPIPPWTLPLRQIRAWFTQRAWAGHAAHIRWQGACGHFEGQASIRS